MATDENADMSDAKSQLSQLHETWKQEIAKSQSQVDVLQKELTELKSCNQASDGNAKKELEATCLVCDWLEAVFPDDGCWIKASSVTSQFL